MNRNKLLILMIILIFIAFILGIACLILDKFPTANWADYFTSEPPEESSANETPGPAETLAPTPTTTAPTTEPTTEPDLSCKGLVLSDSEITLEQEGETWTLKVTTDPLDTTDTVSFVSADPAVAEVSAEGVITAASAGETVITVTCGSVNATCKVICNIASETTGETTVPETLTQDIGYQAAMIAADQIGKPYRYGGAGPDDFDASGLLYYCYKELGISIPRSTPDQAGFGYVVPREELKPGDAIFLWSTTPGQPESVAIYIGNSVAVASFNSKRPVYEFNIESNYYTEHYVYARRFY